MRDDMETGVARSWGRDRRKWHVDRTVQLGTVLVMIVTLGTMGFSGAWWYSEVESRLQSQHDTDLTLRRIDVKLAKDINAQEDRMNDKLLQYRLQQNRQFDTLQSEVRQMRELLERIAFNTSGSDKDEQ